MLGRTALFWRNRFCIYRKRWNVPLALQQLRDIAQLLFCILERGHFLHVRQHQPIHKIVEPLGKFVFLVHLH